MTEIGSPSSASSGSEPAAVTDAPALRAPEQVTVMLLGATPGIASDAASMAASGSTEEQLGGILATERHTGTASSCGTTRLRESMHLLHSSSTPSESNAPGVEQKGRLQQRRRRLEGASACELPAFMLGWLLGRPGCITSSRNSVHGRA